MTQKNYIISRLSVSRILILLLLFSGSFSTVSGQREREDTPPLRERLFYGGNLGLQFGTITDIQVSPIIGLWIRPRLATAIGPDYRFYKDRYNRTDIIGGKIYTQFFIFQDISSFLPVGINTGIFIHLEDDLQSLESAFWKSNPVDEKRFYVNTVLAGGGISQQMGRRSFLHIMVLWPLNESVYDLYGSPELRISFIF